MRIRGAALVAAAALTLTACGGSDEATEVGASSTAEEARASQAVPGVPNQDEYATSGEVDHRKHVKVGKSAVIDAAGTRVKVTSVECGSPAGLVSIDDEGGTVPAKPKAGTEFCVVKGTATNTGKRPVDSPVFYGHENSQQMEYEGPDDVYTGADESDSLNPGQSAPWSTVLEAPKGDRPTGLLTQDADMTFGDEHVDSVVFALPKS